VAANGYSAVNGNKRVRVSWGGYSAAVSNGGEMLVLTRKTNQSIMIGDDVEISVLAVSRDKIRLGITAPRDVPVFRKEVYLSMKEEETGGADASDTVSEALDGLAKKK
jgi:carbon storage regulator